MVPPPIKNLTELQSEVKNINKIALSVDCAIFGFEDDKLKILLIKSDISKFKHRWTLLGDLVSPKEDLDEAAYRILRQRTGLDDVFLEQVHTFGGVNRHPAGRVVTVAYFSLVNIASHELKVLDNELHWHDVGSMADLAFDHSEIFQFCLHKLQRMVLTQPVAFQLLPETFSLRALQNVYEAILGTSLDRRNFRKKIFASDYLVDTGLMEVEVRHRPGKLYRFNREAFSDMEDEKNHVSFS